MSFEVWFKTELLEESKLFGRLISTWLSESDIRTFLSREFTRSKLIFFTIFDWKNSFKSFCPKLGPDEYSITWLQILFNKQDLYFSICSLLYKFGRSLISEIFSRVSIILHTANILFTVLKQHDILSSCWGNLG